MVTSYFSSIFSSDFFFFIYHSFSLSFSPPPVFFSLSPSLPSLAPYIYIDFVNSCTACAVRLELGLGLSMHLEDMSPYLPATCLEEKHSKRRPRRRRRKKRRRREEEEQEEKQERKKRQATYGSSSSSGTFHVPSSFFFVVTEILLYSSIKLFS